MILSRSGLAGAALLLALSVSAGAQTVLTSPEAIGRCLCGERFVVSLHERVEAAQRDYDAADERMQAVHGQVEATRNSVDTADPEQVDAFRRRVREDEGATAHLFNDVAPRTQSVVERYNRRLARYTEECVGRSFDAEVLRQVRATVSCGVDEEAEDQPPP